MYDKRKNEFEERRARSTAAYILIAIGIALLVTNLGLFSFDGFGNFFGMFGSAIGSFFGGLGGFIGTIFGSLAALLANFWPLIPIIIGVALLFRRKRQD